MWTLVEESKKPERRKNVLAYCPDWNNSGYQVCYWNGTKFVYDEQPNDDFNDYVLEWFPFEEH